MHVENVERIKNEKFNLFGWPPEDVARAQQSVFLGNWTIWMLPVVEVFEGLGELSDDEFINLPFNTGVFSFWDENAEDIYDDNDGEPIK